MVYCYGTLILSISNITTNFSDSFSFFLNYIKLIPNDKKLWILIPALLLFFVLLIYNFFKIKSQLKNKITENNTTINYINKEYQLYLFFMGVTMIITEVVF